jgi:hypothetical protein
MLPKLPDKISRKSVLIVSSYMRIDGHLNGQTDSRADKNSKTNGLTSITSLQMCQNEFSSMILESSLIG